MFAEEVITSGTATVLIAGVLSIIAALIAGIIQIIAAIRSTRELVAATGEATKARGVVRDKAIKEVHLLVNSRLLTVLRLLVAVTKREAARTGDDEDIAAYMAARGELERLEAATLAAVEAVSHADEVAAAEAAEAKVVTLLARRRRDDRPILSAVTGAK